MRLQKSAIATQESSQEVSHSSFAGQVRLRPARPGRIPAPAAVRRTHRPTCRPSLSRAGSRGLSRAGSRGRREPRRCEIRRRSRTVRRDGRVADGSASGCTKNRNRPRCRRIRPRTRPITGEIPRITSRYRNADPYGQFLASKDAAQRLARRHQSIDQNCQPGRRIDKLLCAVVSRTSEVDFPSRRNAR